MNQYPPPQVPINQEPVSVLKKKSAVFETSLIRLVLAMLIPGIISGVLKALLPLLYSNELSHTLTEFLCYIPIPLVTAVLSFIFAFSLCKNKKDGVMLIGLNYIIGCVFEIPNTALDIFKAIKGDNINYWFFTASKYLIPVLAFIAFVLLASYLTKHGEKHEMPEPENGYFLTPGKNLLLAAVTIPAICNIIQYIAYFVFGDRLRERIYSAFGNQADYFASAYSDQATQTIFSGSISIVLSVLLVALLLIFCFVRLKYRSEILLFLGAFGIGGLVRGVVSGIIQFIFYLLGIIIDKYTVLNIIQFVLSIVINAVFVLLLMREKNPEKGQSKS